MGPVQFIRKLWHEIYEDDLLGQAAQLAYAMAFSLFPFLILLVSLAAFIPSNGRPRLPLEMTQSMPPQVRDILENRIEEVASSGDKTGIVTFAFLLTIWSASAGATTLVSAVNKAYDVPERRPFWKRRLIGLLLIFAGGLFMFVPAIFGIAGGWLAQILERTPMAPIAPLVDFLRWPVIVLGAFAWLMLLYRVAPEGNARWRLLSPGSIASAIGILVVNRGLTLYVEYSKGMTVIYGALGGFIVLLLWLYCINVVLLIGAEINAIVEAKRTQVPPVPGARRPSPVRRPVEQN